MIDAKTFGAEISAMVRGYVDKSVAPLRKENAALRERNEALEARLKAVEERPEPKDPDLSGIERTVEELRGLVEGIEIPEMPDLDALETRAEEIIAERVAEAVAKIPPAPPGKDADPAALVALGKDIESLREKVAAIKMPEVIHGKNGDSVAATRINEDGELIVKLTNGETLNAGRVIGRDGLGFDDFELEYDGERTLTARFKSGDAVKEYQHKLPIPIDRGVYKEGGQYERGDGVTWAGSYWLAQKDAPEGKPEQSKDWRLSIKRGRDGKPAVKP